MVRFVASLLTAVLLVSSMGTALAAVARDGRAMSAAAEHPGPCPDSEPSSGPCCTDCACACCPGSGFAPPSSGLDSMADVPPSHHAPVASGGGLHPRDDTDRVFRPPRAA